MNAVLETATRGSLDAAAGRGATWRDKILACIYGKSLGGIFGGPLENQKAFHDIPDHPAWPKTLLPNDDLDLQILWLEALQEFGPALRSEDLCTIWRQRCWYNFCEYGVMLNNVQKGIAPPLSGAWNNESFSSSHGCPIRAEIWGLVAPGRPDIARHYAVLDGRIDHEAASIEIEVFYAVATALAMECDDIFAVIEATCAFLGEEHSAVVVHRETAAIWAATRDERKAWKRCVRAFGHRDAGFARTNHAFTMLALLAGAGDFRRTIVAAMRFGWDTDCTASTAAALLGAAQGTGGIPTDWRESLPDRLICNIHIPHKTAGFQQVTDEVLELIPKVMAEFPRPIPEDEAGTHTESRGKVGLRVVYAADPILRRTAPTSVRLELTNRAATSTRLVVTTSGDPGVIVAPGRVEVALAAAETRMIEVRVQRAEPWEQLTDKNLLEVLVEEAGLPVASRRFGLVGARQWLVYGPYWDMWNRRLFAECPYNNAEVVCLPGEVNCATDYYNQHVDLERPYLDEERLAVEDIPEEDPYRIEVGRDRISSADLGAFNGQGCYYLVRDFVCHDPPEHAALMLGRSGMVKAWLDGVLVYENDHYFNWAYHHDEQIAVRLTGRPQRLVVKYVRIGDAADISPVFTRLIDPRLTEGISYVIDSIADLVPAEACLST